MIGLDSKMTNDANGSVLCNFITYMHRNMRIYCIGWMSTKWFGSFWDCGITKQVTFSSKEVNESLDKWHYFHRENECINNLYDSLDGCDNTQFKILLLILITVYLIKKGNNRIKIKE